MRGSVADDSAVVGAVDEAVLAEGGAYGGITAAPLDGEKPAKPPAPKLDLVIATVFDRPKGFTDAAEVALVKAGTWSPATVDFETVARAGPRRGSPPACADVGEFLGHLLDQPVGSLSRVVLVSHSGKDLLGFGGQIEADGTVLIKGSGDESNSLAGGVDIAAIGNLTKSFQPLLDDVKTRWADGGGELVFFSCGSGAGVNFLLMQDFARLIGARARGYSYSIGYCVDNDEKHVFSRGRTTTTSIKNEKLIIDCANAKLGYKHLTPDKP